MKTRPYLFALMACIFMGCDMAEVIDWGADCPGPDTEGELSYIVNESCNADSPKCVISDSEDKESTYDFSQNFKVQRCPKDFPKCVKNDADDNYHCESKKSCAVGSFPCESENGQLICIDPSSNATCGAQESKCNAINYGGQDCSRYGMSSCVKDGEDYSCQCATGAKLCGTMCLNPASNETCGADDCDKDNYGGDNCNAYEDNRECSKDDDGKYRCHCTKGDIVCDGTCITPANNMDYCGAKGGCSDEDPDSSDYRGQKCDPDSGVCKNGQCSCNSNLVWCAIEDLNDSELQCYDPSDDKTCGAHLSDDGIHCETNPCNELYTCQRKSSDEFECAQTGCAEGEQFCMIDGEKSCIPKYSTENCGLCNNNCNLLNYANAIVSGCEDNEGTPTCAFECEEGYENCGDKFAPNCIDLKNNRMNCGKCGESCEDGFICVEGSCNITSCPSNECAINGSTCVNNDNQCGVECKNCKLQDPNAFCQNGACIITDCPKDTHPVFENSQISKCAPNTPQACGPNTMTINDTLDDCTKIANAAEVKCVDSACTVVNCQPNFHLSANQKACVANQNDQCAPTNSSTVQNCNSIANSATVSCQGGKCAVTECKQNFHLNAGKTGCDANGKQICAPTNSNSTKDCTSIANAADVDCVNGACKVKNCSANFHLNGDATGCTATNASACAPTNSSQATNCNSIANAASVACTAGQCTVSNCKSGFHLNSGKTGCVQTTSDSCAATNSNSVINCNNGPKKICVNGTCECSSDNSLVLNYDGDACVIPACQGIPGVTDGETNDYNRCIPTACGPNYSPFFQSNYGACRPRRDNIGGNCTTRGYTHNSGSICCACESGCSGNCKDSYCKSGYMHYHTACIPKDVCCGARCTNCLATGKTCNTSEGKCK